MDSCPLYDKNEKESKGNENKKMTKSEEEFNLSKKRIMFQLGRYIYSEEDVKEFIRRLKDDVFKFSQKDRKCCSRAEEGEINICRFCFPKFIDTLAGDKLKGDEE